MKPELLPLLWGFAIYAARAQEDEEDDELSYKVTEIETDIDTTIVSTISTPVTTHEHVPVTTTTLQQLLLTEGASPTRDYERTYTNQEFVTSYLGDTKAAQEFCDELKTMDAWGSDENGNAKFEVCTLTNDVEIWYFDGYWTDSVEFAEDGTTEVVTRVPATITSTTETLSPRPTTSEEPLSDETAPDGAEAVDSGNSLADSSGSGRDSSSNESSGADGSSMSADTITAESSESSKKGGGGGVLTIYSTQSVEGEKASSEQDIGGCGPEGIHGWAPAFLLSITFLRAVLLSA